MNRATSTISWILLGWFFRFFLVKEIIGKENFSKKKNYILVSNHTSHLDWMIGCYLCAPRKYTFIGQVDKMTGIRGLLRDLTYFWGSTIPVDRNNPESRKKAARMAIGFLRKGYNLFMFPEGTRARDGKLKMFKRGVGNLYLQTGVPILPVAMVGTYQIMPPGGKMKLSRSARIIIGKPREFTEELAAAKNMNSESEEYLRLCEKIAKSAQEEVRALLVQN
jgi:1-acyl-sn-glycerol-3-phosphate acyltransferase